ncbi:carbohydrate kinase [Oscillospiraceae bacterium 44-5]|jgi:fructokinase|uniref:carbohydrate kinase family protein n=1 Tax=Lawsonibacter sp. JLR.KK007 TaxID=3114293 RepID=UPI00216D4DF8|nr:carbohydrate kinase [Lawsonibacter sp.]
MDLYSIGELVIDFTPGNEPASYIRNPGGAPGNAAIAAARSGLSAGVCSSVGEDDFGHFLAQTMEENGVRLLNPEPCTKAITTLAFVTLAPDGNRSFTFARKPGADMFLEESAVKEEEIRDSVIVHAGSCSLSASPAAEATVKALRLGHALGRLVSFDVNYRSVMWNGDQGACAAKVREILPFVDLLKVSDEEVGMVGGEEALPGLMKEYGIAAIAETLGGAGARCFFEGRSWDVPSHKVPCVDTNGAGDAFWGAFLSSLRIQGVEQTSDLTEEVLRRAMEYGSAAGALTVQKKGAIPALPTREEIEAFLAR